MKNQISISKHLRKNNTDAERMLWQYLKAKKINESKFRRQHTIGKYIVDFVCLEKKLIIELDGQPHVKQKKRDLIRDQWLTKEGYEVLRFWNSDVLNHLEETLKMIQTKCCSPSTNPFDSAQGSELAEELLPSREEE